MRPRHPGFDADDATLFKQDAKEITFGVLPDLDLAADMAFALNNNHSNDQNNTPHNSVGFDPFINNINIPAVPTFDTSLLNQHQDPGGVTFGTQPAYDANNHSNNTWNDLFSISNSAFQLSFTNANANTNTNTNTNNEVAASGVFNPTPAVTAPAPDPDLSPGFTLLPEGGDGSGHYFQSTLLESGGYLTPSSIEPTPTTGIIEVERLPQSDGVGVSFGVEPGTTVDPGMAISTGYHNHGMFNSILFPFNALADNNSVPADTAASDAKSDSAVFVPKQYKSGYDMNYRYEDLNSAATADAESSSDSGTGTGNDNLNEAQWLATKANITFGGERLETLNGRGCKACTHTLASDVRCL